MTWYQNAQDSKIWHGERPSVAGQLLYPDKKEKMETTSESAFRPRPAAEWQQKIQKKNMLQCSIQLEGEHSFMTTHREDFCVKDFQPSLFVKQKPPQERRDLAKEMEHVTLYQWDFPPPQHTHRKSTPAVPQPDNLGINPSLRSDFLTIQKETYPCWAFHKACSGTQQKPILSRHVPSSGRYEDFSRPMTKTSQKTESIPHTGLRVPQSAENLSVQM